MQRFRESDEVRQKDRERAIEWYYRNQDRAKQVAREGRKLRYARDPSRAIWEARVRRDKVAQQTPRWADRNTISAIYRKARELGMTVDHTIPLQGKNVSGLHVENNLQIIPKSENSSKGNRFYSEEP
jgi:5-methylcytosine-specific restriction endonuclease McrA